MKKVLLIAMAALLVFAAVSCTSAAQPQTQASEPAAATDAPATEAQESTEPAEAVDTVKIGVILPITGSQSAIGNRQLAGMQLAVEMQNENGGIASLGGAKVELVIADTTGDAQIGVTETERLITSEGIIALCGAYSSAVGAATAPVAERYSIPYMLTNASADEILKNGYKYVYRANFCNGLDGIDMVNYLHELNETMSAGIKNVAIVYENSDWGKGMSNGISNEIEASFKDEFAVVINESYDKDNADFSAIINKIKAADVDVIIPMNYLNDALLFVQSLADYKVNIPVLAHSGGYTVPEFLQNAGSNAEYVMTFAAWDASVLQFKGEKAAEINDRYKKDYSDGVDMDTYSANGWLGAAVLMNAIERAASTDGAAIQQALAATDLAADSYECSLHPFKGIKFSTEAEPKLGMTNQNIYGQSVILQIQNGQYKLIGPSVMIAANESDLVLPIPSWDER